MAIYYNQCRDGWWPHPRRIVDEEGMGLCLEVRLNLISRGRGAGLVCEKDEEDKRVGGWRQKER